VVVGPVVLTLVVVGPVVVTALLVELVPVVVLPIPPVPVATLELLVPVEELPPPLPPPASACPVRWPPHSSIARLARAANHSSFRVSILVMGFP
jgi:hypothetical protein